MSSDPEPVDTADDFDYSWDEPDEPEDEVHGRDDDANPFDEPGTRTIDSI